MRRSSGKVIPLLRAEDRLRDELMTARAILRNAIDGPVDANLLELIEDLADDLKKAVRNYRSGGRTE
jgi:hypothetical protein